MKKKSLQLAKKLILNKEKINSLNTITGGGPNPNATDSICNDRCAVTWTCPQSVDPCVFTWTCQDTQAQCQDSVLQCQATLKPNIFTIC